MFCIGLEVARIQCDNKRTCRDSGLFRLLMRYFFGRIYFLLLSSVHYIIVRLHVDSVEY
jgi:hypothetical protein